jgi:hypothetical protein
LNDSQAVDPFVTNLFFLDKLVKTGKTGLTCFVRQWLDWKSEPREFSRKQKPLGNSEKSESNMDTHRRSQVFSN